MKIEYGATVIDKNDNVLGTVGQVILDSWTGELRKFVVHRTPSGADLFLAPDQVMEAGEGKVKVSVPAE